jgi:hypothetical protein
LAHFGSRSVLKASPKKNYEKRRCRAVAAISGEQCSRSKIFLSNYCWHHQPWGTNIISWVVAATIGLLTNLASAWFADKSPVLSPYLNWQQVSEDMVLVYPSNTPPRSFSLSMKNDGKVPAENIFIMLQFPGMATNSVYGEGWLKEELVVYGQSTANARMRIAAPVLVPPRAIGEFPPIWINTTNVNSLCFFLSYGATGLETKAGRIHLVFLNPDGVTNVYRGRDAKSFIRRFAPIAAERMEVGWTQLK